MYLALWGPLRLLYVAANRAYGTEASEGNLSSTWWLLVLLWFVADVSLVLGLKFLDSVLGGDTKPKEPFWHVISRILPILFLLHLSMLLLEYPVGVRLERVGLGKLEVVVFTAAMIAGAAYFFRSIKSGERPIIDETPRRRRAKITMYFACILAISVLLAIPYLQIVHHRAVR
jgi:hypothetical protein